MTVIENKNPRVQYIGPFSVGDTLPLTFPYVNATDVRCKFDSAEQEININYRIIESNAIVLEEIPAGVKVTLYRDTPLDQQAEFPQTQKFNSEKMNESLDKICMQQQEQAEALDRSIKVPNTVLGFDPTLPEPNPGKAIIFNKEGNGLTTSTVNVDDAIIEAEAARDRAEAAAAKAEDSATVATSQADTATAQANTATAQADRAQSIADNFDTNAAEKQKDFDTNYNDKLAAFNKNAIDKQNDFDINAATLTARYDNNDLAKTNAFNQNAQDMTDGFNQNAMLKIDDFDAHAMEKEIAFDDNASVKTSEFNNNAATKTSEFNNNAAAKQAEVNASAAAAKQSETNAATSETNAAESEKQARLWAIGTIAERPEGSSEHWADEAKKYADQAAKGQVQADWNQLDDTAKDFIKNKPDVVTRGADQDIDSSKTFLKDQGIKSPLLDITTDRSKRGNGLIFIDKNGTQTAGIGPYVNNNGSPECRLIASNGAVSAFAGLGTTKDGQGFFEIPEPSETSDNNDAVTSRWVNNKLKNLPTGSYGIKGDYSSKFGIIKAPNPTIDTTVGSKEITVKAGMMLIMPEDEAVVTVGSDIKYTIQANDRTTLFLADGFVLEAEAVYYQEKEPTDGVKSYLAWYNPKEGEQGTWKFKSNDTGNVWRSAKATPIADVLCTSTNITRIDYIGYMVLNSFSADGAGGNIPVGTMNAFLTSSKWIPEGYHPVNGAEYAKDGIFTELWDKCLTTNAEIGGTVLDTCTYEEYALDLARYGRCARWGVDDVNGRFKFPNIPDETYVGVGTGQSYSAGLPNITGMVGLGETPRTSPPIQSSGAFYLAGENKAGISGPRDNDNQEVYFDASRSNPIYGKSDTVRPKSAMVRWFVYVGKFDVNQAQIDWNKYHQDLSVKLNTDVDNLTQAGIDAIKKIASLSSAKTIYTPNGSWYRQHPNGWLEQGGYSKAGPTITFPQPFSDTNYLALATPDGLYATSIGIHTRKSTSMIVTTANNSTPARWYACGQGV